MCIRDSFQFTASFKERGALNRLLNLNEDERKRGVIAVSYTHLDVYKRQVMIFVFVAGIELDIEKAWENRRESSITCLLYTSRCV